MGFIQGRGTHLNAKFHLGSKHILNMDLKDFFPSIGIEQVRSIFSSLGYNKSVTEQLSEICTLDYCVPQGAPTSPTLANIAASKLDRELIHISTLFGLKYTRYADDLTFSSENFISEEFENGVSAQIIKAGFSVNQRKTRYRSQAGRMEITGLVVNSHVQPPRHWRNKVRMVFFQAKNHPKDFCDRLDELNGYLGAVNAFVAEGEDNKLLTMGKEAVVAVKNIRG